MIIIGTVEGMNEVELYGADGKVLQLVGDAVPVAVSELKKEEATITDEKMATMDEEIRLREINAEVARLAAELEALKSVENHSGDLALLNDEELEALPKEKSNVKKNQKPGKASADRKYTRVGELKTFGKVPQQQADLAAIMVESMDVDAEWTEEELFDLVTTSAKEYASLRNSKQDPTYLFRYYRGLKNDGVHAGFIARGFLRMV